MTPHALALEELSPQYVLFQAAGPRGTFKNSNNLLIVVLKIARYIILIDNNSLLLMKIYWSWGWMSGSMLKISQGNHLQGSTVT